MDKFKNIKGITIISLVVTIIILLILAGISIAMIIGENGIVTKANNAKEETEITEIIKSAQIDILGKQAENDGDITDKQLNEILATYGTVSRNGEDKILTTEKGYIIKVSDIWNGKTKKILAKDVLKINADAQDEASKSPYVKYNKLDCRVLYSDETHGIQIITAKNVDNVNLGYTDDMVSTSDFTYDGSAKVNSNFLKAAASYNNAVDNLNKKAKKYMDTKEIAVDARSLGSNPILNSDSKFQGDTSETWSDTYGYLEEYKWNNRFKDTDDNYEEDINQLNSLGLNVDSEDTWLASRFLDCLSWRTYFYVRCLNSKNYICYMHERGNTDGQSRINGLRPVFLLELDTLISSGDGSIDDPYIVGE